MSKRKLSETNLIDDELKNFFEKSNNNNNSLILKNYDEKNYAIDEFIRKKGNLSLLEKSRIKFVHRFNYSEYSTRISEYDKIFSVNFYVELFKLLNNGKIELIEKIFQHIFTQRTYLWYLFLFFIIINSREIIKLLMEDFKDKDTVYHVLHLFPTIDGYLSFSSDEWRLVFPPKMKNSFVVDYEYILYEILRLQPHAHIFFRQEMGIHSNDDTYNDVDLKMHPYCLTIHTRNIPKYLTYFLNIYQEDVEIEDYKLSQIYSNYKYYYDGWIGRTKHNSIYNICKGFYMFMKFNKRPRTSAHGKTKKRKRSKGPKKKKLETNKKIDFKKLRKQITQKLKAKSKLKKVKTRSKPKNKKK